MKTKWLNRIYKKFNRYFKQELPCSFHNLLWQIMINETLKGRVVVFYPVVTPEGNEMVIASDTGGYNETGVIFKDGNFDKCSTLCQTISLLVFNKEIGGALEDENDYEEVMSNSMGMAV